MKNREIVACPKCKGLLQETSGEMICHRCQKSYPIREGIPIFVESTTQDEKGQEKIFGSWAERDLIDARIDHLEYPNTFQDLRKKRYMDSLNLSKGDFVLDIGTYNGAFLRYLERKNNVIGFGIDISFRCAKHAANCNGNEYSNQFYVAKADELPFSDNSFDAVLCIGILEHLPKPESCIEEVLRVLKPGGKVIFHMPVKDYLWTWTYVQMDVLKKSASAESIGHFYHQIKTSREYLSIFEQIGFVNVKGSKFGILISCTHDWYFSPHLSRALVSLKGILRKNPSDLGIGNEVGGG